MICIHYLRWIVGVVLVLLLLSLPVISQAANFKVVPIKIYFVEGQKTQVMKLVNEDEESVTLQLEALEWRQDGEGKDNYHVTKDVVMFPKIVKINPRAEQLIRLGYQGSAVTTTERSYRIFLTELPVSRPGGTELKMTMRLSVPLFVSPAKGVPVLEVAKMVVEKQVVHVEVSNPGPHHGYVKQLQVVGQNKSGEDVVRAEASGWYVLPGARRTFSIDLPAHDCSSVSIVQLRMRYANKDLNRPMVDVTGTVSPSRCSLPAP